ncbi:MAG: ABC transporter ATP-binding protein [Anaerolineaceae bacterium]|nr:ABC transporter ATP-binding protein [Anaerolineaceae bacterium]
MSVNLEAAPLLKLDDVHASYGNIHALKGVSLQVDEGEIVTLIGSNGAGKSTTLRTISGLMRARAGKILFRGEDLQARATHELVGLGVALVPEGRRVFARLSVTENLEMGAWHRDDRKEIAADIEYAFNLFPRLGERKNQLAGTMSGGEQQMLATARALMSRPSLLLMDEPSMGLAPVLVETIFDTIVQINSEGTTILLVEQNAQMALRVASRGYVLQSGNIVFDDDAVSLRENPVVQKAYLGMD